MQRFSTMSRLAAGAVALVAAIALGAGAYAMWGDDGGGPTPAQDTATEQDGGGGVGLGMCAPGVTDCVDVIVEDGGGAAGACLEGATDCVDNPANGDAARCAADGPDCMEPIVADPGCVDDGSGNVTCEPACYGDDTIEPANPPVEHPAQTGAEGAARAEEERARAAEDDCAPVPCDPDAGGECLAPDCTVSSDGTVTCPEPVEGDGNGAGTGEGSLPGASGETAPRTEPGAPEVDPGQ